MKKSQQQESQPKFEIDFTQLRTLRSNLSSTRDWLIRKGTKPDIEITSMPILSEKIWGLQKRELCVIGGRPSNGKTSFALQIAKDASEKCKVIFISLEMSTEACVAKLFTNIMQVDNDLLRNNGFTTYQDAWDSFSEKVQSHRLVISQSIGKSWEEILQVLNSLTDKPDLIILDYIQCVSGIGFQKIEVIDEYVKNFRQMAIEHDFAGVLLSQVNRSSIKENNNEPQMVGLKNSGFLEEHADKVLLLYYEYHHDHTKDKNRFKVTVAKNRNGDTGACYINFIPQFSRFEDIVLTGRAKEIQQMFSKEKDWDEKESAVNLPYAND